MNNNDTNLIYAKPVQDALASFASVSKEVSDAEPAEVDRLLIEALDHANLLNTRSTKYIAFALLEAQRFLVDIKDKSLADQMAYLAKRKSARRAHWIGKSIGSASLLAISLALLLPEIMPDLEKSILAGIKTPIAPPNLDGSCIIYGFLYFVVSAGWFVGGAVARWLPIIRPYVAKHTWKEYLGETMLVASITCLGYCLPALLEVTNPYLVAGAVGGISGISLVACLQVVFSALLPLVLFTGTLSLSARGFFQELLKG